MMKKNIEADKKVIVFQLEKEEYALSVEQVGSIERLQSITRVPQTSTFIKGIINLRGVVIPVIDLRTRFGMEEIAHTESTRIIIAHLEDIEVGLIVDTANDVIDLPADIIESAPEVVGTVNVDYISGVAKLDKRLLILLDLNKVLTIDEMTDIQSMEG